jgi:DNA-binding response OmpR family regulator
MPRDVYFQPRRVLLIGQTMATSDTVLKQVLDSGYLEYDAVDSLATGFTKATAAVRQYDAILLASALPDGDGAELCTRLRDNGINVPILLLSTDSSEAAVVHGLESGANDYLSAPFRFAETLARVHAQIRAYEVSEEAVLKIDIFNFRPASRILHNTVTGQRTKLTEKEASVLKYLYRAEGPVPRHVLLHEVWGYNARTTTHTVETHIYRLRRKIEPDANQISVLINVEGGYLLNTDQPRTQTTRTFETAQLAAAF